MCQTFSDLYTPLCCEYHLECAKQKLTQGIDGFTYACQRTDQGEPETVLAFLLLVEEDEEKKCSILARAYEIRAMLLEKKAEMLSKSLHHSFLLLKWVAHIDRLAAKQICAMKAPSFKEICSPILVWNNLTV